MQTLTQPLLAKAYGSDKAPAPSVAEHKLNTLPRTEAEVVFITELCSGGSLNEFLKKSGTVRCSVLKKVLRQVLQGLVVLHEHGAIHRDLKAEMVRGSSR